MYVYASVMTVQPWEPRVARLEGAYEQVDRRLGAIEARLETLDRKLDAGFEAIRRELGASIEGVRDELGRQQWRMTSLIVATWITVMLAILLHKP